MSEAHPLLFYEILSISTKITDTLARKPGNVEASDVYDRTERSRVSGNERNGKRNSISIAI